MIQIDASILVPSVPIDEKKVMCKEEGETCAKGECCVEMGLDCEVTGGYVRMKNDGPQPLQARAAARV